MWSEWSEPKERGFFSSTLAMCRTQERKREFVAVTAQGAKGGVAGDSAREHGVLAGHHCEVSFATTCCLDLLTVTVIEASTALLSHLPQRRCE